MVLMWGLDLINIKIWWLNSVRRESGQHLKYLAPTKITQGCIGSSLL